MTSIALAHAVRIVLLVGVGAFFNVLNFGQMYGLHILFFPIAVGTLVAVHVVLVRMRGVVKPIDPPGAQATGPESPSSEPQATLGPVA